MEIKLENAAWEIDLDRPLGEPGGFGSVFVGNGTDSEVAVKQLHLSAEEAAYRELEIARSLFGSDLKHVVPILDFGQDANSHRYYIVMPICDRSLQQEIERQGPMPPMEALDVLRAVICGLSEVKEVVHRDLKPANILFHDGAWKIADFGIAKFVENSTSTKTLRDCLSPQYGAPEQWLLQGPTSATDLYAVGCIAHAILTGKPPFCGTIEELKEKHLKEAPQQLQILPAAARTAVHHMLRKNPELRPSIERCLELFTAAEAETDAAASGHLAGMVEAVSELADQRAREESRAIAAEDRKQRRSSILAEALSDLQRIRSRLFVEIERHASELVDHRSESQIRIGAASLVFDATLGAIGKDGIRESDSESASGDGGWGVHKRQSNWDIVAHGLIRLEQRASNSTYVRSANLVFGRPNEAVEYRWYEMAFWSFSRKERDEPYGLEYPWELDEALSSVMGINNIAHDPKPMDAEDEDQFIDYWLSQLSKAMRGHLHPPRQLPFSR